MKDIWFVVCLIMIMSSPVMVSGVEGLATICLQVFFLGFYGFATEWLDEQ